MNQKNLKLIGYFVALILILNIVLFAFVVTNWIVFWTVLAAGFVFVKWVLPKLKD
tara:strand:- start:352 stop:516 length:165 start_codon:yes stop_codon:yes gene_type:complete